MQKRERVALQIFDGKPDDVLGAREPRMRMADTAFALQIPGTQPIVRQCKALAAVVVLAVIDADRASVLKHGAMPRHAIGRACKDFRQMQRRARILAAAEQQYLAVKL